MQRGYLYPDHNRPLMTRTFTLLLTILTVGTAMAQQARYFQADVPLDRGQLKQLIQQVVDLDPSAEVFTEHDMRTLAVVASAQVGDQQLQQALQLPGRSVQPMAAPSATPALGAKPMLIDTGDPAGDRERYVHAVHQWNLEHPEDIIFLPHFTDSTE